MRGSISSRQRLSLCAIAAFLIPQDVCKPKPAVALRLRPPPETTIKVMGIQGSPATEQDLPHVTTETTDDVSGGATAASVEECRAVATKVEDTCTRLLTEPKQELYECVKPIETVHCREVTQLVLGVCRAKLLREEIPRKYNKNQYECTPKERVVQVSIRKGPTTSYITINHFCYSSRFTAKNRRTYIHTYEKSVYTGSQAGR